MHFRETDLSRSSVSRIVHSLSSDVFGYHFFGSSSGFSRPRLTSVTLKTVSSQFERPIEQNPYQNKPFPNSPTSLLTLKDLDINTLLSMPTKPRGICYIRMNINSSTCVFEHLTRLLIQRTFFQRKALYSYEYYYSFPKDVATVNTQLP